MAGQMQDRTVVDHQEGSEEAVGPSCPEEGLAFPLVDLSFLVGARANRGEGRDLGSAEEAL